MLSYVEFPETHWSQLLELNNPAHPRHAEHWEALARRYWRPIYCYARAMRDLPAQDAEDLTQRFFEMMLRRVDFAKLTPERGSFRGFLKTALRRFVVSEDRRGGSETARLPFEEAERAWEDVRRRGAPSPEEAFDREWARGVLEEALARLRRELEAEGKGWQYALFREYCLDPQADVSYEALAERHKVSLDDVRNGLRSVRQRGREAIKDLLRDYLLPGENIDDELRFVLSR